MVKMVCEIIKIELLCIKITQWLRKTANVQIVISGT